MTLTNNGWLPQNPIFIVGYPRSGTTLLQILLLTQPGVFSFPETHYFGVIEKQMQFDENGNILPSCLDNLFEKIDKKMESRFTNKEIKTFYRLAEGKKLSSKSFFEFIVTRFLLKQPGIDGSASFRWIEKTPTHANYLARVIEFYPNAQVLHILRHPVPAIFSRKLKFPFNKQTPVTVLARRWNRLLQNVEHFRERFPGYIYALRYEDLVEDMEKTLGAVGDFLHINIDFTLISNTELKRVSKSLILPLETWKLEDIKQNLANTNDTYKEIITKTDAESVEIIVNEKMRKYGYHPYFD